MIDFVVRNARVAGRSEPSLDIGFEQGRIAAVEPKLVCDAPSYDAEGCLCGAGLCETHIHLDKSRIYDRCAPEPAGRAARAMERVSEVKPTLTVEDVIARASTTIEESIKHGVTRMRTHCEVDPRVGLRGFEGVKALVDKYKWAIDLTICVMPQEGLT
ncbi:MAG: amidohydrolase, partial [Variibacter sp.]|nr:amidohydrolase [Variibacter sp.]